MTPAYRKKRAFFRWRGVDSANAALGRIGRFRLGRGGVLGMHRTIEKARANDVKRKLARVR